MHRHPTVPFAVLLLPLLLLPMSRGAAQQNADHCIECHGKEAAVEATRPHARAGITCVECHGGDASKADKAAAKAEGTGYKGKLPRTAFPRLCGDCHSDVRRMNPYGIATDQLAQYRTSRHGVAFLTEGQTKAATCVDCHGYHGIVGAKDAESPVHPQNVPKTCAKCHGDAKLVEEVGLEGGEVVAYEKSVHYKLLVDGDLSAPQCATCHGNHGAVPPGFRRVSAVCGKCHIRERELFETSPHARLVAGGDFESCVACHSNHEVKPAGSQILERTCRLCHEKGHTGLKVRDALLSALTGVETRYETTKKAVTAAKSLGFATPDDEVLLDEARTAVVAMHAQQHALDPKILAKTVDLFESKIARIGERVDAARSIERLKRLWLLPVILFLVVVSFVSWLRFRRIHSTPHEFDHE